MKREEKNGINTRKLPPKTKFFIRTCTNLYMFENIDDKGRVIVKGGKFFPEETEVYFVGSTFGGSMIRIGWLAYRMRMEFHTKDDVITTSPVLDVCIVAPEWKYHMDWDKDSVEISMEEENEFE